MGNALPDMRWFHVILTTYGAWLPGDPRGFRTRDHRDHVEGDYKSPPPRGIYEGLHRSAKRSQTDPTMTFHQTEKKQVAEWLWDRLTGLGGQMAIVAVAARHAHLLSKMPPKSTREWIAACKRHVTFNFKDHGINRKIWAQGAKFVPIKDWPHQLNVFRYIARHVDEGAYVRRYIKPCGPADAVGGL
jgi:hypothetical protein